MDLNGDKSIDLVSGSYDGPLSLFAGQGDRVFSAPDTLKDESGAKIQIDNATSVAPYDWNKDGKQDLVVGTISGRVWYLENAGGATFKPPVPLDIEDANDGGPCAVDWDQDGEMDLFLGQDNGRLRYFHGMKGGKKPSFDQVIEIFSDLTPLECEPIRALPGKKLDWAIERPRMRPKPYVCDFNGDGKKDLLIGDFCVLEGAPKELSSEDQARYEMLRGKQDDLRARAAKINDELAHATYKELGVEFGKKLTDEQSLKYTEIFDQLYQANTAIQQIDKELNEIFTELQPLMPPIDYHGFVWLCLGTK